MRRFFLTVVLLTACVSLSAAKVGIGGRMGNFPSPAWLDGKSRTLKEVAAGKKFTVIYLWAPDQAALSDFSIITGIAERYKDSVNFASIAFGQSDRLKKFPAAMRLGFPVNADPEQALLALVEIPEGRLPLALVLDESHTIFWCGKSVALPRVLNECLAGKFDLKEEIRKSQFSRAVNTAVKAGEFRHAAKLLKEEWNRTPDSYELLNALVVLYTRKLNAPAEAFNIIHEAQRKNPGKHRFYEAEYRLLGNPAHEKRLPDFFARVKKEFAAKPGVLMAFAIAEMGRPAEKLDMALVISLAELGWVSNGFKDAAERGLFALEYAKIAHAVGRTDLARSLAQNAYIALKNDKKRREAARQATLYYSKLQLAGSKMKIPDLKK